MEKIKNILVDTLKRKKFYKKISENLVIVYWKEIVGDELIRYTNPSYIKNGILFVDVTNSMWAHHLTFLKQDIINKINKKIKKNIVKDIRFRCGSFSPDNSVSDEETEVDINVDNISINEHEITLIDSYVSEIPDDTIKTLMKEIITTDFKKKKLKKLTNKIKER